MVAWDFHQLLVVPSRRLKENGPHTWRVGKSKNAASRIQLPTRAMGYLVRVPKPVSTCFAKYPRLDKESAAGTTVYVVFVRHPMF